MPKGQWDREAARARRESMQAQHDHPLTIAPRAVEPPLPDPLIFPPGGMVDGNKVHYKPVRVDLSLGAKPPVAEAVVEPPVAEPQSAPYVVRLLLPYSYYDDSGALRSWVEGELVSDPATIALLASRGAMFTESVGDTDGLHPDARSHKPPLPPPETSPLRIVAPYEFVEPDGSRRFWIIGEYVSDPETAALLRRRGAEYIDAE